MCVSGGAVGSVSRTPAQIERDNTARALVRKHNGMIGQLMVDQKMAARMIDKIPLLEERLAIAEWRIFCLAMLIVGLTGGIIVGQLT